MSCELGFYLWFEKSPRESQRRSCSWTFEEILIEFWQSNIWLCDVVHKHWWIFIYFYYWDYVILLCGDLPPYSLRGWQGGNHQVLYVWRANIGG